MSKHIFISFSVEHFVLVIWKLALESKKKSGHPWTRTWFFEGDFTVIITNVLNMFFFIYIFVCRSWWPPGTSGSLSWSSRLFWFISWKKSTTKTLPPMLMHCGGGRWVVQHKDRTLSHCVPDKMSGQTEQFFSGEITWSDLTTEAEQFKFHFQLKTVKSEVKKKCKCYY